jgi:uncharacterized protein with HEPN domain
MTEGKRNLKEFSANITKRRAAERELEIIGEAASKLLKLQPDFPLSSARKIVNLRNGVIHAYDNVDETIIWKIIVADLSVLLGEVEELLLQ